MPVIRLRRLRQNHDDSVKKKTPLNNRTFLVALAASLTLHGIFFLQAASLSLSSWGNEKKIEVSYLKTPQGEPKHIPKPIPQFKDNQEFLKLPSRITIDNSIPPRYGDQRKISGKPIFNKPAFVKPDIIAIKKKINLPPVDMDKINNPSYISYYQIVREKIRRAAYQNYSRTETGEAYVSFIISNDGSLKEVRLVGEKSSLSQYLREIALKSIKEAMPFPNFPKELDYPQLSFNVIISFEIE